MTVHHTHTHTNTQIQNVQDGCADCGICVLPDVSLSRRSTRSLPGLSSPRVLFLSAPLPPLYVRLSLTRTLPDPPLRPSLHLSWLPVCLCLFSFTHIHHSPVHQAIQLIMFFTVLLTTCGSQPWLSVPT